MPYIHGLPAALRRRGLTVEVVPGWETRGSPSFNPVGSVSHWTAGPNGGDRPSLKVCVNGRPGLGGPLCNVFLTRNGVAVVVAAGRANHAGKGGAGGLRGNSSVFGTEAENSGGGGWTKEQRWAYPRINAAYVDLGASRKHIYGHHEWAPGRKIDIQDWPMDAMRDAVLGLVTPVPEPAKDLRVLKKKGRQMLVIKLGRSKWSLITGDRLVRISEDLGMQLVAQGLPFAHVDQEDFDALRGALTAEA